LPCAYYGGFGSLKSRSGIFLEIFQKFSFFFIFVFTASGQAVYTLALVKTVKTGNPYNFLADSAFLVA
jgi:hypothetical protein